MIYVHPSAGARIRLLLKDCSGTLITPSLVTSIKYSIWNLTSGSARNGTVTGHSNVTIPTSKLSSTELEDPDTELKYNFEYLISAKVNSPFPNNNKDYEIEIIFYDINNEPHAQSIFVRAKTNQ